MEDAKYEGMCFKFKKYVCQRQWRKLCILLKLCPLLADIFQYGYIVKAVQFNWINVATPGKECTYFYSNKLTETRDNFVYLHKRIHVYMSPRTNFAEVCYVIASPLEDNVLINRYIREHVEFVYF